MKLAKFHSNICSGDIMLLYCHLPPVYSCQTCGKGYYFFPLLCFASVSTYNRRPDRTVCNCKQPSCLDEQVCATVKQLVWCIRFQAASLSPHSPLSYFFSYPHFEVLVSAFYFLMFIFYYLSYNSVHL